MKMLTKCKMLFRFDEWYDSKVPMLLLPVFYTILIEKNATIVAALRNVFLLIFFDATFLAFGYLINDYADMDVDKKAGKVKLMHQLPMRVSKCLVIGTAVIGCIPVLFVSHEWETFLVLAVIYFFGSSYSARPLRFKERGVWGLLVSSTAQRCFPLLLIPVLFEQSVTIGYLFWLLLSFCVGIRYILVHQYIDAENDRKSGVETYAIDNLSKVAFLIKCTFVIEIIVNILLLFPVCREYRWTLGMIAGYTCLSVIRWRGCKMVYGHGGLYSFEQVPLEDFYNNYLPLLFAVLLSSRDLKWGILIILWVVLLLKSTIKHLEFPVKICVNQLKRKVGKDNNER